VFAVAGTGAAHAYSGTPTVTESQFWSIVSNPATAPDDLTYPSEADRDRINGQLDRGRRASRVLPALRTLGSVALGVGAFQLGWQIGGLPGGIIYRKLTGTGVGQSSATITLTWTVGDYVLTLYGGASTTFTDYWALRNSPVGTFYCYGLNGGSCHTAFNGIAALVDASTIGTPTRATDASCSGTGERWCGARLATQAQFNAGVDSSARTAAQHSAATYPKVTTSYSQPADLGTVADKTAARNAAIGAPGVAQTAAQADTEEYACKTTYGAGASQCVDPADFYTLPQPQPNETYTAYTARLQALGALGTITSTVLASELAGYGPDAVARVSYTVGTTTTVLAPLAWPAASPSLDKATNIVLRYNPSTAAPAPTAGAGGGTQIVAPEPYTPPGGLDFSPLTPVEACTKFPFGVVCWIADQLELLFLQPADAPSVSVTIPAFDAGFAVIPAIPFAFDFGDAKYAGVFDTYISVVRSALAFLLWLGGLWFVGTRLLGVRGAPDTEGMD
jgi:hypothetical protein